MISRTSQCERCACSAASTASTAAGSPAARSTTVPISGSFSRRRRIASSNSRNARTAHDWSPAARNSSGVVGHSTCGGDPSGLPGAEIVNSNAVTAVGTNAQFIYEDDAKNLWFDSNGTDAGGLYLIAVFTNATINNANLGTNDFDFQL